MEYLWATEAPTDGLYTRTPTLLYTNIPVFRVFEFGGSDLKLSSLASLSDPVKIKRFYFFRKSIKDVLRNCGHDILNFSGFVLDSPPIFRAGHQNIDIQPPRRKTNGERSSGVVGAVWRCCVPQSAVHHHYASGRAGDMYFVGERRCRWVLMGTGRIAVEEVTAGEDECAAIFRSEGGKHPERRQVSHNVRIRFRKVAGISLIKGPVGMPVAALVAREIDDGGSK